MLYARQIPGVMAGKALAALLVCAGILAVGFWMRWRFPSVAEGSLPNSLRPELALRGIGQVILYVFALLALGRWLREVKLLCLDRVD